ncbi:peptidylprolyl isomerase [Granulicella tundricola]|uniref:peptidylprolyl isomerase n=1 Tax=Granulicella tundricola (strain ATCC BAA-1859 / DSM 23138 / MP5ACTX9) TaxID=1198114 RepID=E8X6E4_GRATM|nr:peptidylprolyl isomerase [Granulicella tundricola]ADW71028.1 peptidyl-prolyl cis-trans isomerase cyclophilin type [Granulicella tundricola MP5ACTX9]
MMDYILWLVLAAPFWLSHYAPKVFRVRVDTTVGSFVIETHRAWSPHGADRFYELVRARYYDDNRFFRVVPAHWVQFGVNGNPQVAQQWRHRTIADDPLLCHNTPGFIGFSNTAPNTRSTQVYINTGDNSARNDVEAGFAPFGRVVEGMDIVEKIYSGYGEHSGGGMRAGHQDQMFAGGNAYFDREFPRLDKLLSVSLISFDQPSLPDNICHAGNEHPKPKED